MISSSILNNPYWLGNPLVLETSMVEEESVMSVDNVVELTIASGARWSNFKYWSRLSVMSIGPPWYSCEM